MGVCGVGGGVGVWGGGTHTLSCSEVCFHVLFPRNDRLDTIASATPVVAQLNMHLSCSITKTMGRGYCCELPYAVWCGVWLMLTFQHSAQ
jgi:hypothetical protein